MRIIIFFCLIMLFSCQQGGQQKAIQMDNLFAWCVVPFDSKERSPEERIQMLSQLGFNKYAYDWRQKHLPEMASEWTLAEENDIEVMAVWMWIDSNQDSIGKLSSSNEKVLKTIEETGLKTQLWVSFNSNYFEALNQEEAVSKGAEMIKYLCDRTEPLGCKLGLYNHGDWFGEPENQIEIIKALPQCSLGLIYNFHHGHHQIANFPELIDQMLPYLWAVNLNGMKKEGPKILAIGKGTEEKEMLLTLLEKGYKGPLGILGHVQDADVEVILKENLAGVKALF